jgi:ferredoxin-type protein NapH
VINIKNIVTRTKHIVQLSWFIFFANGILFGLPAFGTSSYLRYIFIPNLTTKYLVNTPTHCYFFELQSGVQAGFSQYYINLIIPLLVLFVLLLLLARFWCGWLCPVGFVQDMMMYLRRIFRLPYKELDYSVIRILDRTKFAILFIVILLVFLLSLPAYGLGALQSELNAPFEQFCPARPMFVYLQQLLGWEPWSTGVPMLGVIVLGFFFVSTFMVRKFYCRICPVGAINSFFNKYSLLTLQKDGSKCTKCRICLRACPMDIEEIYEEKDKTNISAKECIHCYRCVELCPEDDCLSVAFLGKTIIRSKHPAHKFKFSISKGKSSQITGPPTSGVTEQKVKISSLMNNISPPPPGGSK